MDSLALSRPYRFRFTDTDDVGRFGDGWHLYDEAAILRLPARQQALLEAQLGVSLLYIMFGFRDNTAMGRLGATWVALQLKGPALAGDFKDYSPLVFLLDIEQGLPPEEDVTVPLDPTPSGGSQNSPVTA